MGITGVVMYAIAGAALLNGMPHFVAGSAGRVFRSPFGRYSSARTNVAWGLGNIALAIALVFGRLASTAPSTAEVIWFLVGALVAVAFFGVRAADFFDDRDTVAERHDDA